MSRQWVMRPGEALRTWTIGSVTVSRIGEAVLESFLDDPSADESFLGRATTEVLLGQPGMAPDFVTSQGALRLAFQCYVIDTGDFRIVVDTCVGNDKHRPHQPFWEQLKLPFLENLAGAGYSREAIDVVTCTHLHVDHVGWNTMLVDGAWVPTFPNAAYLFNRVEFEYWRDTARTADSGRSAPEVFMSDSIQPIVDAGLERLVDANHLICDEVTLVPTPGHTPGHVSVLIRSDGQEALITGDVIHHPIQIVHPDWGIAADGDSTAARNTRQAMIDESACTQRLLIGTHWGGRASGRVVRSGDGYSLIQDSA